MDREMYMNCVLVNIKNPNTSMVALNTPEIFKANIGRYGAYITIAGADVTFPDPGDSRDESLGDRHLNEPMALDEGPVLLPDPAPEVGTIQQSSVAISEGRVRQEVFQKFLMFMVIIISILIV